MAARLIDPARSGAPPGAVANVLIVSGFPWYTSELAIHRYLTDLYPAVAPVTTRLYTNPTNGASRGHCFVEYPPQTQSASTAAAPHSTSLGGPSPAPLADGGAEKAAAAGSDADAKLPRVLREVKERIEAHPYECIYLKVHAYALTAQRWSRAGRLPELPTDPPPSQWRVRGGVLAGYGDEGFVVRCGAELGLPNTLTMEGQERLERLRKRLRAASARRASGHSDS